MPYLTVDEVESALAVASGPPNTSFTQLITLPHRTWDLRQCHAIKIANGSGPDRIGVYFLGGVHGREWGSSDILINFVVQLTVAFVNGFGIILGGKTFSADQIQSIVNKLDVFVFPQANPDGREFSMTNDPMWRKNRRPAPAGHPDCLGVDINRNYDFVWNYPTFFHPAAPIQNSTDPCHFFDYIGPSAVSEPETQNVVWLLDTNPNIRYFVDMHSYGEEILYSWNDDENQSSNRAMNFQNPAFNGKRGIAGDSYQEFMPYSHLASTIDFANEMRAAIQKVRGHVYTVRQSAPFTTAAGTSKDYCFSRHFVDPGKGKITSYALEWGSWANPTPFHPPFPEMLDIIQEVTAGLLQFCLLAQAEFPLVRSGDSGERVKTVQFLLVQRGAALNVDGIFGSLTKQAVESFQTSSGLSVDGIVGPNTWGPLIITRQLNDTGSAVRAIQSQLVSRGVSLNIDGVFGPMTKGAVETFQNSQGIVVNGIVGPATWRLLVQ